MLHLLLLVHLSCTQVAQTAGSLMRFMCVYWTFYLTDSLACFRSSLTMHTQAVNMHKQREKKNLLFQCNRLTHESCMHQLCIDTHTMDDEWDIAIASIVTVTVQEFYSSDTICSGDLLEESNNYSIHGHYLSKLKCHWEKVAASHVVEKAKRLGYLRQQLDRWKCSLHSARAENLFLWACLYSHWHQCCCCCRFWCWL